MDSLLVDGSLRCHGSLNTIGSLVFDGIIGRIGSLKPDGYLDSVDSLRNIGASLEQWLALRVRYSRDSRLVRQ